MSYFAFRCSMANGRAITVRETSRKQLEVAKHFLVVAERQRLSAPLLMAHRVMGATLCLSGKLGAARRHLDQAVALYRPEEHRPLATRFGQDIGVAALGYRAYAHTA